LSRRNEAARSRRVAPRLVARSLAALAPLLAAGCGPDWDALAPDRTAADQATACPGPACLACDSASDCPGVDTACQVRVCIDHACGLWTEASGTPAAVQRKADCLAAVCDGMGAVIAVPDDNDLPDDGNDCTTDACEGGVASNMPRSAGASCGQDGANLCDGEGLCVACLTPVDCGTDTACQRFSCEAATCSSTTLPVGASCGASSRCDAAAACIACTPASTSSFEAVAISMAIPDGDATGATSVLPVSGLAGALADVDVRVDVGDHPAAGDLAISLIAPSGTEIPLTRRNGGDAANAFAGTTFDDGAGLRVTEAVFANGAALARVAPERSLALLNGEPPNGDWSLRVADLAANGAAGTLDGWSIALTVQQDNPLLAPSTFASVTDLAIPSGDLSGATAKISVEGVAGSLREVTITVDIAHPDSRELTVTLESPVGKTVRLTTKNGAGVADTFADTTFDDRAPLLIGCDGPGCLALTGGPVERAAPEGALSALVGDAPNGDWKLHVVDDRSGRVGTLEAWSLTLTPALCATGP
jgi:subtilisin-like proprotein convertase family protein